MITIETKNEGVLNHISRSKLRVFEIIANIPKSITVYNIYNSKHSNIGTGSFQKRIYSIVITANIDKYAAWRILSNYKAVVVKVQYVKVSRPFSLVAKES